MNLKLRQERNIPPLLQEDFAPMGLGISLMAVSTNMPLLTELESEPMPKSNALEQ